VSGSRQREWLRGILEGSPSILFLLLSQNHFDMRLAGWTGATLAAAVLVGFGVLRVPQNPITLGINMHLLIVTIDRTAVLRRRAGQRPDAIRIRVSRSALDHIRRRLRPDGILPSRIYRHRAASTRETLVVFARSSGGIGGRRRVVIHVQRARFLCGRYPDHGAVWTAALAHRSVAGSRRPKRWSALARSGFCPDRR
jgi:hypothetical protein